MKGASADEGVNAQVLKVRPCRVLFSYVWCRPGLGGPAFPGPSVLKATLWVPLVPSTAPPAPSWWPLIPKMF